MSDGTGFTQLLSDWPQDVPVSHALGGIGMPGYKCDSSLSLDDKLVLH